MAEQVDLELSIHRRDSYWYVVNLRVVSSQSSLDALVSSPVRINLGELRKEQKNERAYGAHLGETILHSSKELSNAFTRTKDEAARLQVPLRFRLVIGPSATELHSVRWELISDPQTGRSLCTDREVCFSRYLTSTDWKSVGLISNRSLRILTAFANPESGLEQDGLSRISKELDFESDGLGFEAGDFHRLTDDGPVTAARILSELRSGYEVLYLVCHGAFDTEEAIPYLYLENDDRVAERYDGLRLAEGIAELETRPQLVFLASCETAGAHADALWAAEEHLASLAPRLAEMGVAAVVGMNGPLSQQTARDFIPEFFKELRVDGKIDRAFSSARNSVRDREDWWRPVLYTRLRSGRLWFTSGLFGEDVRWGTLKQRIDEDKIIPILGPGVADYVLGSRREIAARWAASQHYPMATDRESLPQVAQYLRIKENETYPSYMLEQHLKKVILEKHTEALRAEAFEQLRDGDGGDSHFKEDPEELLRDWSLNQLVRAVGRQTMKANPDEPHRFLARLNLPIYITMNPSTLMEDALAFEDMTPTVGYFKWKQPRRDDDWEWPKSVFDRDQNWYPDPEKPDHLVYHVFGSLEQRESVVLAEDDYFDYMLSIREKNDLPPRIGRVLNRSSLVFLGFRMDDWGFRVLFRSIVAREGERLRSNVKGHVAVQLDPEVSETVDPQEAVKYLRRYFETSNINVYWGSVSDFIKDLKIHLG